MDRRKFVKTSSVLLTGTLVWPASGLGQKQRLKFGWVTDIHYAFRETKWNRFYTESILKLKEAVELFNSSRLDFVIETGDFKDQNEQPDYEKTMQYLKKVEGEFAKYKGDRFHVFGNHDVDSISKDDFLNIVENSGIPKDKSYYSFERNGIKCIVLDACFRFTRVSRPQSAAPSQICTVLGAKGEVGASRRREAGGRLNMQHTLPLTEPGMSALAQDVTIR